MIQYADVSKKPAASFKVEVIENVGMFMYKERNNKC
jgi:CRISPR/Cas system-associated protein Cas7 (RAMP superfamily)